MKASPSSIGGSLRNQGRFFRAQVLAIMLFTIGCVGVASSAQAATLYGATASGGPGELYILDSSTGGVIQDIGSLHDALNVNYGITGLAFNPVNGLLYGSTANSN